MPRYVVERTFDVDEDAMPEVGRRSRQIAGEQFPEIVWEHSHVVVDDDGTLKSFCVYAAPDADTIRRHGALLGSHVIDHIYEIGGDVTPEDFPLELPDLEVPSGEASEVAGGLGGF
jgi:hypothetical protein